MLVVLIAALALATPEPLPSATPAGPLPPVPSAAPMPLPTSVVSPSPSASPVPTPTPTVIYRFRYVPAPPTPAPGQTSAADVTPRIIEVDLNDQTLKAPGPIDIHVTTTPDVVKVVSRANGHEGVVAQVGPGEFASHGQIPKVPFFIKGWTFQLEFVATTADGKTASLKVPFKVK